MAVFQLAMRRSGFEKGQFLGQEIRALLHRIALQAVIDQLVILIEQVKLKLRRGMGGKAHICRTLGHPLENIARTAFHH